MTARPFRTPLVSVLVLACALTVLSLAAPPEPASPRLEPAADLSSWNAGNIIEDAVFHDADSMTAAQIKSFLALKGANCRKSAGEPACIKDLVLTTTSRAADAYCNRYQGATESAAAMIKKVGVACGINPRVLIVMLQKEQGIVTQRTATAHEYSRAMGYGCPDHANGQCDSLYNGLFNQVYNAARRFKVYAAHPENYGYRAGRANRILYNPNSACGSSWVTIENQATANLYIYTPYQPNKAALDAGYGTGNSCSAYGNRNFYNWFTDWFGSTYVLNRDPDAPRGRLEAVQDRVESVRVKGWVFDPNSPAASMAVSVYAGGTKIGTDVTDQARPDVATANHGAGGEQGFEATLPLSAGRHTVCVYAVNIGAGSSNPRLGCATLTVTTEASWNPEGAVSDVRVSGTRLVVEGWSFDPDAPAWPSTVRVYAGRLRIGDVVADDELASVGEAHPTAGSEHGFRLDTRLTAGTHKVCVYSFNKGSGTTNPVLGCRTVTVTAPPLTAPITTGDPLGRVAVVEREDGDGQDVEIRGWSFDPDAATAPATVRIVAGAKVLGTVVADGDWADVQRYFPYAGSAHGFTWRGILPHGSYDLCVQGVNQGAGSTVSIGCQAVTVAGDPTRNPKGRLAAAADTGTDVAVEGWSYDPDALTSPVTVRLYAGSTKLGDVVADEQWPDLAEYHPAAGTAHGFSWEGPLPAGSHKICAYALNVKYGTTNPALGCLTVDVVSGSEVGRETVAPPNGGSTPPDPETSGTSETPGTSSSSSNAPDGSEEEGSPDAGTSDAGSPDAGTSDGAAEPAAVPASPTP